MAKEPPYTLEWYLDEKGRDVVRAWILDDLTPRQRRAIGVAMFEILQHEGEKVVESEFGKHLGDGLYEFRVRQGPEEVLKRSRRSSVSLLEKLRDSIAEAQGRKEAAERILLRVFFHVHGDKLILLLGGYDKGKHPSKRHQQAQIELARKRLDEWRQSGRSAV